MPLVKALVPSVPPVSIPTPDCEIPVRDSNGASTGATGQALQIGTGKPATLLVPARVRSGIELTNLSTVDVWLGFDGSVTATSGHLLLGVKGTCKFIETQAPIYAVVQSGIGQVSWMEIWDE
jgi:hypothetical protein